MVSETIDEKLLKILIGIGHKCTSCGSHRLTALNGDINTPFENITVECNNCKRIVRLPDLEIDGIETIGRH